MHGFTGEASNEARRAEAGIIDDRELPVVFVNSGVAEKNLPRLNAG